MDSPVQTKQHKKDASNKISETDFSLKQGERWEKTSGEKKKNSTLLNKIRNSCLGSNSATASQNLLTCPQLLVSQFTESKKNIYIKSIGQKWQKGNKVIGHVSFRGQKEETEVKKGKLQFLSL